MLDVGVGGGAASLPLVPPAGLVVGVDDAEGMLEEMGLDVACEAFERPWEPFGADRAGTVAMARERLCVGPERDAEVEALLERAAARSPVQRSVTVWWPGTASGG